MNCQNHLYVNINTKGVACRWFLQQCGVGLGAIALSQLLGNDGLAVPVNVRPAHPLSPKQPHFAPRAKHVNFLSMAGAPSQPGSCQSPATALALRAPSGPASPAELHGTLSPLRRNCR